MNGLHRCPIPRFRKDAKPWTCQGCGQRWVAGTAHWVREQFVDVNLGRDAYESYAESLASHGTLSPPWSEQSEEVQQAWEEAALSVVGSVVMKSMGLT